MERDRPSRPSPSGFPRRGARESSSHPLQRGVPQKRRDVRPSAHTNAAKAAQQLATARDGPEQPAQRSNGRDAKQPRDQRCPGRPATAAERPHSLPVAYAALSQGGQAGNGQREVAVIRRLPSGEYRLLSRKKNPNTGKRKNLGTFKTREAAEKHERAVQFFKRQCPRRERARRRAGPGSAWSTSPDASSPSIPSLPPVAWPHGRRSRAGPGDE